MNTQSLRRKARSRHSLPCTSVHCWPVSECEFVAELEESGHIDRVESLGRFPLEAVGDPGEVIGKAILGRHRIELGQVADSLGVDQRRHRAPEHRQKAPRHGLRALPHARVPDHVEVGRPFHLEPLHHLAPVDARRGQEQLRRDAAVDVHLVVWLPACLDFDHDGGECARNGGGGEDDVVDEFPGLRRADGGNPRDVPDDRPPGIEIGGAHEERSAIGALGCNGGDDRGIEVACNELPQARGAERSIATHDVQQAARLHEVVGRVTGIDLPQHPVVRRAEESERCDQGAGADARHDLELGPGALLRPAHQQPGAERAVAAAAGDHQVIVFASHDAAVPTAQLLWRKV
jgi:hypothetical protein